MIASDFKIKNPAITAWTQLLKNAPISLILNTLIFFIFFAKKDIKKALEIAPNNPIKNTGLNNFPLKIDPKKVFIIAIKTVFNIPKPLIAEIKTGKFENPHLAPGNPIGRGIKDSKK